MRVDDVVQNMLSRDRSILVSRPSIRGLLLGVLLLPLACAGTGGGPAGDTDAGDDDDDDDDDDDGSGETDDAASTSASSSGAATVTATSATDSAESGSESDSDTDAPPSGPHALGVIVLGEVHPATGGNAEPVVTAGFVPDAAGALGCVVEVAGCRVQQRPHCDAACGEGDACVLDADCNSVCETFCNAECDSDEICYFPSPGKAACRTREAFDAGVLSFVGTTTPITLFPPYSYGGDIGGSPFVPDQDITVTASGADDAGFEAFERSFDAPPFIQTDLEDLTLGELFGAGSIPVSWSPGSDDVEIMVSVEPTGGVLGSATCAASDAAGAFEIPRAVVDALLDGEGPREIALSITRRRTSVHYDLSTRGMLSEAIVQDVGWLELRGESTETFSEEVETCGNCSYEADHEGCGQESFDCTQHTACLQIYNCTAVCYGWQGCIDDCIAQYPAGAAAWAELAACRCDACPLECLSECS